MSTFEFEEAVIQSLTGRKEEIHLTFPLPEVDISKNIFNLQI